MIDFNLREVLGHNQSISNVTQKVFKVVAKEN